MFDKNDLFSAAQRTFAKANKTAANAKLYWWGDAKQIQQTLQWVEKNPAPFFAVQWDGYAGGDSTFRLTPLKAQPKTFDEVAQAIGENPVYLAAISEEGYVSYISKTELVGLLQNQVQNPEGDPEPFQTSFDSPADLPGFSEQYDLSSDPENAEPWLPENQGGSTNNG